jgi:hypothetical protein
MPIVDGAATWWPGKRMPTCCQCNVGHPAPFWMGCSGSPPLHPRSLPLWLLRFWAIEEVSEGQAVQFRWGTSWGSGTVVYPATCVLCGGYNETCAALGQVPKQWWSVPVACLVLPFVCCHCGVVIVVKYIWYTFLDPCLCFTWTTLIYLGTDNLSQVNISFKIMILCILHYSFMGRNFTLKTEAAVSSETLVITHETISLAL